MKVILTYQFNLSLQVIGTHIPFYIDVSKRNVHAHHFLFEFCISFPHFQDNFRLVFELLGAFLRYSR